MMRRMDSFRDIIGKFGGAAKFADAVGIEGFHAQTMKQRNSIPPAYWSDTVSAAEARGIEGITFEALASIAKAKTASQPQGAGQ